MARSDQERDQDKPDWFWAISTGVILAAMGIGSLFGWIASRKQEPEKPARREKPERERKPEPEKAPAAEE